MLLPQSPRILVLAVPGLGDALLATPVTASIKIAYPDSSISMMVREGREAALEGNPDIDEVIPIPRRPKLRQDLRVISRIFRRFDLVVSTSSSDRSFGSCLMAASRRVSVVPELRLKDWWKHLGIQHRLINDNSMHVVQRNLALCEVMDIKPYARIVPPRYTTSSEEFESLLGVTTEERKYLVVHMLPEASYKKWPNAYWRELLQKLSTTAQQIILTSGPIAEEIEMTKLIAQEAPSNVFEVAGRLRFAQLTKLLEESCGFIGPDTSVTHLASALGVPTVALFGPSTSIKWGPWPVDFQGSQAPFTDEPGLQSVGNVRLLRANCFCEPKKNTCRANTSHPSACLSQITPEQVISAWESLDQSKDSFSSLTEAVQR